MSIKHLATTALLSCAMILSSCDAAKKKPDTQGKPPTIIVATLQSLWGLTKRNKPAAAVDPRIQLTRKIIDDAKIPILFAHVPSRDAYATLSVLSQNSDVTTWVTADGISLSLKRGVLVASRGLGDDLMGATVSPALSAIAAGGGSSTRLHDFLSGDNHTHQIRFQCTAQSAGHEVLDIVGLRVPTRHVVERCSSPDRQIENHYWLTKNSRIVQSRQWLSPEIKSVFLQQLSR